MNNIEKINEKIEQVKTEMNDPHLCEGTADTYSRVSGYYRSVQGGWNNGKQQEFAERQEYSI